MTLAFFVSDLHGSAHRYDALVRTIASERPEAVFMGGDILPAPHQGALATFLREDFAPRLRRLRALLQSGYPRIFLIFGNDDPREFESQLLEMESEGLLVYLHRRRSRLGSSPVLGYCCVPPTPFRLKDWERYDVSRYVDPGCISPEEGWRSVDADESDVKYGTIARDLEELTKGVDLSHAICLFHSPPYQTPLDRAALDGVAVDHVPLDTHIGSIAIRRFIESSQPLVTLHGHVHESARITGQWKERIGSTTILGAAHDGPELALVRFDPESPHEATRELL
ncbi:MAG: metallophosphoesterase [Thermoanaerobaculia bacterium]